MESEDDPAAKQISDRRNESPLDTFVVFLPLKSEIPERYWRSFPEVNGKRPMLFALGNVDQERPATPVYLAQLRGEDDAPWNVLKDNSSLSGGWEQTPEMLNPKILDSFLNDYLRKIALYR